MKIMKNFFTFQESPPTCNLVATTDAHFPYAAISPSELVLVFPSAGGSLLWNHGFPLLGQHLIYITKTFTLIPWL